MTSQSLLEGKKVLLADDEPDVLETLTDLLSMCSLSTASDFETAETLLNTEPFDIAILDIMGINGYQLLDIAKEKGVTAVMLTAHAFSVEDTVKSFKKGAAYYIPKENISEIVSYLEEVLEAKQKGKNSFVSWLVRLGPLYNSRFGEDWQEEDKDFWERFKYYV